MAIHTAAADEDVLPPFTPTKPFLRSLTLPTPAALRTTIAHQLSNVQFRATLLCFVIIVTVDMAGYLSSAPQVRLFESIVCLDYYRENDPGLIGGDGGVPEELCKVDSVQREIAMLNGMQTLFSNIPGVVLAIPFGVMADRYGRRPMLMLTLLGLSLSSAWVLLICWFSLPIKLTWLSSLFYTLGGGASVGSALILMIIADVTPAAQRSTLFFHLQASVLLSELVAPLLGSLLMSRNVWIPLLAGLAIQTVGIPIAALLPETKSTHATTAAEGADDEEAPPPKQKKGESDYRAVLSFLLADLNTALLVLTFLVATIGRQALEMLLQYVSKRYSWPLATANMLFSLRAGINLLLLLLLLPFLGTALLSRFGYTSAAKDLLIARVSIALMAAGFGVIGVSPGAAGMVLGLGVYTLGSGFGAAARSLVTGMVRREEVGRLYTAIAVADMVGGLVAGPALSWCFAVGMAWGGVLVGLPFIVAAGLFVAVGGVVMGVRIREGEGEAREGYVRVDGEEDGEEGGRE
ncbi:uncharacterized protein H6S33_008180 [Morchella sextelata]|uniref:uncharacterized protein n=1 Tax=Morchella sextelata TaxID=1174677 RepID=UPI001D04E97B|nr:uncharacterized protein H6S33_008180 [Morchella sextelata]KAH0603176.1 hypothetical protein H6S33_008180 [Morchella sextelata]